MTSSIFKAYDIRGTSPGELDAGVARRLGKSIAAVFKPKHVVVGRDMRLTSDELESALIEGLVISGVNVTRIGLCSTPMFNFAIGDASGRYDLGVMVTASHNPAQYNGFKLTRANLLPIGNGAGMEELKDRAMSDEPMLDAKVRGSVDSDDQVLSRYVAKVRSLVDIPKSFTDSSWRIVADAGNGMNGLVLPKLTATLGGLEVDHLFWDLDGTFPNHEANPIKIETLETLRELVTKRDCQFGVAFDGDGDRVGFVDEQGTPIAADILTALFAQELLRQTGSGRILFDVRSSWSVPEVIRESGGEPIMCRVGHAYIKKLMKEQDALFGGELSGHFYFRDFGNCESSDYAFLLLLQMVLREKQPLSALWRPLCRYVHSGEINFSVKQPTVKLEELEKRFRERATAIIHIDGLRMEFREAGNPEEDWWFSVRASNTEPLVRLNLEAKTKEQMEAHKAELSAILTA